MQNDEKKPGFLTDIFAGLRAQVDATRLQDIAEISSVMQALRYKAPRFQIPSRLYRVRNKGSGKGAKLARLREIEKDQFLDRLYAETIVDDNPSRQVLRRIDREAVKRMGVRHYSVRGKTVITRANGERSIMRQPEAATE